jgi:hypothetical protein
MQTVGSSSSGPRIPDRVGSSYRNLPWQVIRRCTAAFREAASGQPKDHHFSCHALHSPATITGIMGSRDARVDAYIAQAADFAQPVLNELRDIVHEGCPDVEETMKWSMPFFLYKGILCNMSAFKQHCAFGFWKGGRMLDAAGHELSDEAMGQFGRITSLKDLPPRRVFLGYVKQAKQLRDEGVKPPPKPRAAKPELPTPDYLTAALKAPARVCRMASRGQNGCHAAEAAGDSHRMAGGRKVAPLEVREVLRR